MKEQKKKLVIEMLREIERLSLDIIEKQLDGQYHPIETVAFVFQQLTFQLSKDIVSFPLKNEIIEKKESKLQTNAQKKITQYH